MTAGTFAAALLDAAGTVRLDPGLTPAETAALQRRYGVTLADDHRDLLAAALPVGPRWPDWRSGDEARLRARLAAPVDGVLFDVHHNAFWYDPWGPRPADAGAAVAAARAALADAPALVPLYGHRYLPAAPAGPGHPVLSVSQTDVICYGTDLADWVHREFGAGEPGADPATPVVDFWRDLL